jgi:hypothetical protein
MSIAAPNTGVIKANIRITKNSAIDKKGTNTRLLRKPGIERVRLVINKFVNDMVVLKPDNKTLTIAMSCAPNPVNCVLLEKGVIKVHPDITKLGFLHLTLFDFFLFCFKMFVASDHEDPTHSSQKPANQ